MMIQVPLFTRFRVLILIMTCAGNVLSTGANETLANDATSSKKTIDYLIDLSDAKNHYVTITATVPTSGKTTELMMAVWTPGSYLVREYARHVDSMEIKSEDGKALEFAKTRKNRWSVQTKGAQQISVSYRLYCNELSVRTNWLDRQFAIFSGAATFITSPELLSLPHVVQLKMPTGWTRSATSLRTTGDSPHTYTAENFDELVDSPIVAGNLEVFAFDVGGIGHQLVNVGEAASWDGTKAATDLKRIVAEHQKMWGVVPYDRYLFLNIICESRGGLEHDNSTMIMTSRWGFRDEKQYQDWLSLASHEFFHTWNVRRLRPKSLIQYDYENEIYTESLWIAEGITSYYEDLALVRAGLINQKEYLARLSANCVATQGANGRKIESLANSSYDAWIKFYRPDENSANTRVNYYSKGATVAFLLDAKIRKLTKGKKCLDDVMRKMFESYSKSGYTADDFRKTASKLAGHDLSDWFRSAVDSTDELDYSDVQWLGLNVPGTSPVAANEVTKEGTKENNDTKANEKTSPAKVKPAKKADEAKMEKQASDDVAEKKSTEKKQSKPKPWLGIRAASQDGKLIIGGIESQSPATAAGLNTGDEIIAINGYRVSGSIDVRLKQFKIGDEITLLVSRREQLFDLPIVIGTENDIDWKLKPINKQSEKQKQQLESWLR